MKRIGCLFICLFLCASFCLPVRASGDVPESVLQQTASVVRIQCRALGGKTALGSGFVVGDDKGIPLIATNYHVVKDDPYSVSVWVDAYSPMGAEILAADADRDLCILRLNQPVGIAPLTLVKNSAEQGDAVYAVGFPSAADNLSDSDAHTGREATVTDGIVSAVRSFSVTGRSTPVRLLQASAAINPGNSGGPLFNSSGEVVGINTYGIQDSQGIFGAIDVSELRDLMQENRLQPGKQDTSSEMGIFLAAAGLMVLTAVVITIIWARGYRKKALKLRRLLPLGIAAVFAVMAIGVYGISYGMACGYADRGETEQARSCLMMPAVTKLHDRNLMRYLDAAELLADRRYDKAREAYLRLGNYRNSAEMVLEADYRQAAQLADQGDFEAAIGIYTQLSTVSYKDSAEKITQTGYRKALHALYEDKDYAEAARLLADRNYDKEPNIETLRSEVSGGLYHQAVELYHNGKYEEADIIFRRMRDIGDSASYLLLIQAHRETNAFNNEVPIEELKAIFGFEDSAQMCLYYHETAVEFLRGYWKPSSGKQYFRMDENDKVDLNLPDIKVGRHYVIEAGEFRLYDEGKKDQASTVFTITAQGPDSIKIYCHKNGKTYTLYRQ